MRPAPTTALLAGAATAAGAFVWLAISVARRETKPIDHSVRERVPDARDGDSSAAAEAIGPLGKDWLLVPLAVCVSGYLWRRGAGTGALLPAVAAVTAATETWLFDEHLHIQRPPPGHPKRHEPSFPSGHALRTTAVGLTSAYALARDAKVNPAPAFALASFLAVLSPGGRIYLDRHWASDVVGGWLAGLTTAALCSAGYEWCAGRPSPALWHGRV